MTASKTLALAIAAIVAIGAPGVLPAAHTVQIDGTDDHARVRTVVGSGTLVTMYEDVERVALADESIARVQIISAREVLVTGLRPGRTTLFVWQTDGVRNRIQLEVERDLELLDKALRDLDESIVIEASADGSAIVLLGDVADEKIAREAENRATTVLDASGATARVMNLIRFPGSVASIDELLGEMLADIDPRITVRRIQVGDDPDVDKDSFVLEGRVRTVQEMVKAVTLAERQLGGTGGAIKASDPERLNYERNRSFLGGGIGGRGGSSGGTQALTGSDPPKNSLSAQLARGLILTSESGRVISLLQVDELYQVMVSIRVLEVDRSKARQIGFNYRIDGDKISIGNYTGPQGRDFADITEASIGGIQAGANLVGAFVDQTMAIIAAIDFLEDKALARAVAEPNILTLSGESATVVVGGEVPIPTSTVNQVAAVQGYYFQDFGVRLDIRPTVDEQGMIAVEASPSIARPSAGLGVGDVPGFIVQSVQTTARVKAGHSLVIGGLLSFQEGIEERKLPGLGNIPVVKSLFSWKRRSREERELLFIITPRIVEPPDHLAADAAVEPIDPAAVELPDLHWTEDRDGWKDDFEPQILRPDGIPPGFVPVSFEGEELEEEWAPYDPSDEVVEAEISADDAAAEAEVEREMEAILEAEDEYVPATWVVQPWAEPCLNLRPQPRSWSTPLACIRSGTRVEELAREGAWLFVLLDDGREGWMATAYLKPE